MRAASPAVKLTYDDFVLFPDDGKGFAATLDRIFTVEPKRQAGRRLP